MKEIIEGILSKYPANKKDRLLPILQEIQNVNGFLNEEILAMVGRYLNLPVNKVYGVAAFYDQFRFRASGKYHVRICNGTACYLHGTETYLQEIRKQLGVAPGTTSKDGRYSLEVTNCMGACDCSPVLAVNEKYYPRLTPAELTRILRSMKDNTL